MHCCVDPNVCHGLNYRSRDIWGWRARFTFEHCQDKGFTGGFFQRFDGKYDRHCLTLDYTPETLAQVVRNFTNWAQASLTDSIKVDKVVLPATVIDAARRLSCSIWEPPGDFFTKRGLVLFIR